MMMRFKVKIMLMESRLLEEIERCIVLCASLKVWEGD